MPAVGADDSGEHERDYRRSRRSRKRSSLPQRLRQLGEVRHHPPRLALGEQLRRRAPTGLVLETDAGERLSFEGNRDLVR
jgi:hypothetical protein